MTEQQMQNWREIVLMIVGLLAVAGLVKIVEML